MLASVHFNDEFCSYWMHHSSGYNEQKERNIDEGFYDEEERKSMTNAHQGRFPQPNEKITKKIPCRGWVMNLFSIELVDAKNAAEHWEKWNLKYLDADGSPICMRTIPWRIEYHLRK